MVLQWGSFSGYLESRHSHPKSGQGLTQLKILKDIAESAVFGPTFCQKRSIFLLTFEIIHFSFETIQFAWIRFFGVKNVVVGLFKRKVALNSVLGRCRGEGGWSIPRSASSMGVEQREFVTSISVCDPFSNFLASSKCMQGSKQSGRI